MSDYANKLAAIADKKAKLAEQESKLVEKRKKEIGDLAERCGLLTMSDEIIAGVFQDLNQAILSEDKRVNGWESLGEKFLKAKKANASAITENSGAAG